MADNGLDKVKLAIKKLVSINFLSINTDKIKLLVQRNNTKVLSLSSKKDGQIEAYAKDIAKIYSEMLNLSCSKEAKII